MYVKRRELGQFVSDAIRKELACRKEGLRQAYLASNTDEGQLEGMEEWKDTKNETWPNRFQRYRQ